MDSTRTIIAIGLGVLLLVVAAAAGAVLSLSDQGTTARPATPLTATWAGSGRHPACVYLPKRKVVAASVVVTGDVEDEEWVRVTVAAYADENTSHRVGSKSRKVTVDGGADGGVHQAVELRVPVRRPPHVDEDGVAACSLGTSSGGD